MLGSVAALVVTIAIRGRATVKIFCIKFNRIRHPYRRGVHPTSQWAPSTALSFNHFLITKKPTFLEWVLNIISDYLGFVKKSKLYINFLFSPFAIFNTQIINFLFSCRNIQPFFKFCCQSNSIFMPILFT